MSIKVLSTLYCEKVEVDPDTLARSLINIRSSINASRDKKETDDQFLIPSSVALFVIARTDISDHCDNFIAVDVELHLEINGKVVPNSKKPLKIRIEEGLYVTNQTFNLPAIQLECPSGEFSFYEFCAVLSIEEKEIGRAAMPVFIDRRY